MRDLPVITPSSGSSNCAPCIVGKTLGRRECPGLKARRGLIRLAQAIGRLFARPRR